MFRVTTEKIYCDICHHLEDCEDPCNCWVSLGVREVLSRKAWERLKAIEDILGDSYDLDGLQLIMNAYRHNRCFTSPFEVGDTAYFLVHDTFNTGFTSSWFILEETVCEVSLNMIFTNINRYDGIGMDAVFGALGKSIFRNRADAEKALERQRAEEKRIKAFLDVAEDIILKEVSIASQVPVEILKGGGQK